MEQFLQKSRGKESVSYLRNVIQSMHEGDCVIGLYVQWIVEVRKQFIDELLGRKFMLTFGIEYQ